MKLFAALLALFGVTGQAADHPAYAPGQVWEYRTRPADTGSLLKIQRVEADPRGKPIYHISVIGAHLGGKDGQEVQHLPVSRETLDQSVIRLSRSAILFPDPSAGIATWREANGGVFTISVAEIIGIIDAQMPSSSE